MKKILIIDDSALMRRVMSDIINSESGVYAADTAENGEIAVELLKGQKQYDLILLDINMPKMNGIRFLEFLNEAGYEIPTLVVSAIASKSAEETIRALELGAYDFVKKPEGMFGVSGGDFREQLLMKVKCAFQVKSASYLKKLKEEKKTKPVLKTDWARKAGGSKGGKGNIIFIASSTGGPKALQSVIPKFPKNIGCPIVVVQHMPAGFTSSLADRLDEMSQCRVVEASDGDVLQNGMIYVAKGGYQLSVSQTGIHEHTLAVRKDPARNGLRPCADIFLESLLDSGYEKIFCAVLTGMGNDATKGLLQLKKIKDVYTVAQNESTCVVYGMPRAVAKEGIADDVADLEDIAGLLMKKVM